MCDLCVHVCLTCKHVCDVCMDVYDVCTCVICVCVCLWWVNPDVKSLVFSNSQENLGSKEGKNYKNLFYLVPKTRLRAVRALSHFILTGTPEGWIL